MLKAKAIVLMALLAIAIGVWVYPQPTKGHEVDVSKWVAGVEGRTTPLCVANEDGTPVDEKTMSKVNAAFARARTNRDFEPAPQPLSIVSKVLSQLISQAQFKPICLLSLIIGLKESSSSIIHGLLGMSRCVSLDYATVCPTLYMLRQRNLTTHRSLRRLSWLDLA